MRKCHLIHLKNNSACLRSLLSVQIVLGGKVEGNSQKAGCFVFLVAPPLGMVSPL